MNNSHNTGAYNLSLCLAIGIPVAWVLSHGIAVLANIAAWPLVGLLVTSYVTYKVVEHVKIGALAAEQKSQLRIQSTFSNTARVAAFKQRTGFCC